MSLADLFMHQILNALEIDKEEIMPMVKNIGTTVQNFDAKLSRIEAKLDAIIQAQDIQPLVNEDPQNEIIFADNDISDASEIAE